MPTKNNFLITHAFFVSNTLSNARLKIAKNQANTKQHPEAELLLLKIFHILHPRYQTKIIGHILKNKQNNKCVCIHAISHTENEHENENRSHRYNTNRPMPRDGHRYSKF